MRNWLLFWIHLYIWLIFFKKSFFLQFFHTRHFDHIFPSPTSSRLSPPPCLHNFMFSFYQNKKIPQTKIKTNKPTKQNKTPTNQQDKNLSQQNKTTAKSTQKTLVSVLSWADTLALSLVGIPSDTSMKKAGLPFPSRYNWLIISWLGGGTLCRFPVSVLEFPMGHVQVLCSQPQPLWVHM